MLPKPPYYKQETSYSCAPACLRMVLENLGVIKNEQELRELCDCTPMSGTGALQLVDAAKALGFTESAKHNLVFDPLDNLKLFLGQSVYPIAYLRVRFVDTQYLEQHAVVVVEFDGSEIRILDPLRGDITYRIEEFMRDWERMRNLAVLIQ